MKQEKTKKSNNKNILTQIHVWLWVYHKTLMLPHCFQIPYQFSEEDQYISIKPMGDFLMTSTGSTEPEIFRYVKPLFQSSISHSRLLWVQEKHKTYEFMKDSLIQSDHCAFPFFCYFFIHLLIYQPAVKTRVVDKCYMQSVMQKLAAFLSRQHAKFGIQQDIMETDQFSKVHSSHWIIFLHSCQASRQGPCC